jgi:hypothetical protein
MVSFLIAVAFAPPRSARVVPKFLVENVSSKLIDYIEETKIEYALGDKATNVCQGSFES